MHHLACSEDIDREELDRLRNWEQIRIAEDAKKADIDAKKKEEEDKQKAAAESEKLKQVP